MIVMHLMFEKALKGQQFYPKSKLKLYKVDDIIKPPNTCRIPRDASVYNFVVKLSLFRYGSFIIFNPLAAIDAKMRHLHPPGSSAYSLNDIHGPHRGF